MDLTETLVPKSDQLNAEDLLAGPRTVTVEKVTKGSVEQPVDIHLTEFPGRPFRPSKTVRRILVMAWGPEATNYTGRRMTLYRDPAVRFGADAVGGIRVSHLSHLDKPLTLALTETRGKRRAHRIDPLAAEPTPPAAGPNLNDLFTEGGLDKTRKDERLTVAKVILKRPEITSVGDLNADDIKALVDQLAAWQTSGKLGEEIDNILDLAAIEADGAK